MLTRLIFSILFCVAIQCVFAQVGHTTFTFNDPTRTGGFGSGGGSGRQIQTEIYYPAATTGDNVAILPGEYPVIVFGHGFVMSWDSYDNIWEHYTALGYIVAFPRTEGGILPNHGDFGLDLRLVADSIVQLNTTLSSVLYGSISPNTAIIGHSMGGGATILAGANNTTIKAIVGLAPAETNPSAIGGATLVNVPALILSGSEDGVTPPDEHHEPIYNALASSCKSFSSIIGGGHCYFANANTNCDFGELTTIFNVTINRAQQHARMFLVLDPFLAYHLKENCAAKEEFLSVMDLDPLGLVNQTTCVADPIPTITQIGQTLSTAVIGTQYQWLLNGNEIIGANQQDYVVSQNGGYQVQVTFADGCSDVSAVFNVNTNSVGEEKNEVYSIYPNPSEGKYYIKNDSTKLLELMVYSAQGRLIATYKTTSLIDLSEFEAGVYFVELEKHIYRLVKK